MPFGQNGNMGLIYYLQLYGLPHRYHIQFFLEWTGTHELGRV